MAFSQIKKLLHKVIGLHVETIGESSIDRAISHRMHETMCSNSISYYKLIRSDGLELDELIEEVVVPETWFFRNIAPFEVLRDNALKMHASIVKSGLSRKSNKEEYDSLKVLSLPCSSGEEPYSIAMVLREAGLRNKDFIIDAVDISKKALKKSCLAIYGKHSFREKEINFQSKYLKLVKSKFHVLPDICDCVSFREGNIITDSISPIDEYYDIIFCRNLLIYFDRETQRKVLNKLSVMLKCGGVLFVGHAESGQIDKNRFTKVRVAKAFAFRKKITNKLMGFPSSSNEQPVSKLKDIYDQLVEITKKDVELSKKFSNQKFNTIKNKYKNTDDRFFCKINLLVDKGCLPDALILCEQFLKKHPENSETHYYLGMINALLDNDSEAENFLKKSIYLFPDHYRALALSAVLAEKRGDEEGARLLRRREQKARKRNP